ncbi:LysR family transcriptional regulator substrate-binding protein [Streptomyces sp. H27-C3]|uniref:LysR family transcriptional regulator substrate-binding protein n=1 Tax=Streptomyces sp. H27-C3 TaxID=3046305 RepID=UPI0032D90C3D
MQRRSGTEGPFEVVGAQFDAFEVGSEELEGPGVVIDEPLVAAVSPGDPAVTYLGRTSIPLAGLRDRPLISLPRGTGLRGVLDRACAQAGFQPRIAFEAAAPPFLAQLAARGLGVAVIPALTADEAAGFGVRTLEITEPKLRGRVALTWRTDGPSTPAATVFLDLLRTRLTVPGAG